MRDNMPLLSSLNLSGVNIEAYSGTEGTSGTITTEYPANEIPANAFYNLVTNINKPSLISVTLPLSISSIGTGAFTACRGLTSITVPNSVTSIGSSAFYNCTGLTSIYASAISPLDLSMSGSVFAYVGKITCKLYVPSGSRILYQAAVQWKDFTNIIEVTTTALPVLSDVGNIKVYPNPVNDHLTIEGLTTDTRISIFDTNGHVMLDKTMHYDNSISVGSLLRGPYILQLLNSGGMKCFKIFKQ